jgi:vacuolar protein sorting-associated protein 11
VTVVRGDFIHDRGTKQRIVFESEDPVTALEVREGAVTVLYIATTGRISILVISGKGQGQPARTIDNTGCGVGCMTIDPSTRDIIVARDDAVYSYGAKGRGASFAFEGPKKIVKMYESYVGLVCPPRVSQVSKSKTFRRLGADEIDGLFTTTSFSLLDTDLRYVAHTEQLSSQVKNVFVEWGELYLIAEDGKVCLVDNDPTCSDANRPQLYRYQEKSLQQKLEILYERNLYILAINLAQKEGIDKIQQNIIFRKYGDYLYQKGDYDTAMQQYLRAIDNTEPSQVIRKFLDTQRIQNLIDYLAELHEHDKATADHTTLLLNCYAKLKDTEKLDTFIKAPGELKFDLDTAITMCRQGGYFEQAAYLATKHGENDLVVDILIEDSKKYAEALEFIWRLAPEVTYANLMRYARVLLEHCPVETTKLFVDFYTGKYKPKQELIVAEEGQPQSRPGAFQSLSALLPLSYMNRTTVAATGTANEQTAAMADATGNGDAEPSPPAYSIPKPRTAFSSFIAHPDEFITFLEALIAQNNLSPLDRAEVSTALFEMYLESANSSATSPSANQQLKEKAKALIVSPDQASQQDASSIDTSNVLLISSLSHFPAGTTLVRERANLYPDIFRSFASAKDTSGAISALRKYGPEDPSLYTLALSYFSSSSTILLEPGVKDELQRVLQKIDQQNLMAPLQVVKVLSQGGAVTMGMVKSYLADNIARERKEIQSNRKIIESYRTETASKKAELEDLRNKPTTFQGRRCSSCGGNLDLPTVHFMCKHSFHQRCLNSTTAGDATDKGSECPICKPSNDTIKAIRRAQIEHTGQHELFKSALERSSDRFETVSEFFGRGVMTAAPIVE